MGVLMLLKGEYEHAEEYLNVAYESGLKVAGYNLEELTRKKANASEFRIKNRDK
jgi:hypothetical protein